MDNFISNDNKNRIQADILLNRAINDYENCKNSLFKRPQRVSFLEQILNERQIRKLSKQLLNEIDHYIDKNFKEMTSKETKEIKKIFTSYILKLDERKLLFDKPFLKFFLDQGYLNAAEDFIECAKRKDGNLTAEEIFQAMRNVLIMNSLQIFWGIPLSITPSIYSYSMLYPYTDNFLDSTEVDIKDKISFNEKLTAFLKGEKVSTVNFHENRVRELVENIESQYNRNTYPQVFQSIELIQEAQVKSLKQDTIARMTSQDILSISFFKGGSSVLADAFLVKGNLTKEESHFAFGYGAFLQLLDDLQDALTDKKDGHQTLFSMLNNSIDSDNIVNQLIYYIFYVNAPQEGDNQTMTFMKEVIKSCTLIMIMEAIGNHPEMVSQNLYHKLESCSKVRLKFYKEFGLQMKTMIERFDLRLE